MSSKRGGVSRERGPDGSLSDVCGQTPDDAVAKTRLSSGSKTLTIGKGFS